MLILKEPKTPQEFSAYYDLRWRILRQPWKQPRGSEKDDKEQVAYHLMVVKEEKLLVPLGVGRIHLNSQKEAQIRYMAVEPNWERKGVGRTILKKLEIQAQKVQNARKIFLNAREGAVEFYKKFGYQKVKKAHTLFGKIPHYKMEKIEMNWYEKKLEQYITRNNLKAEQLFFKKTCHTVNDAAKAAQAKPKEVIKSIGLLDSKNNLIVAIVLGTDRVSLEKISKNLNIEPPRIAKPKEILEISGYPCGGIPPFGFAARFLIDQNVMKKEIVYAGGGSNKSLIQVSPKELQKANGGQILKLRK